MFENASSFTGCAADLWGRAADLPANFGTFGGDHVAINGPVDYWVYDPSDGNIIVAREDSNVLKMIKISQDGTIASVADPIRHGSGNPLPTITSAADLISDFYNPQQAGSHLLYTFTKGTGFDDITFGHKLNWNVSNVTSIKNMFKGATQFNSNISEWNVSKVTNMDSMFENASSFNHDISGWDVSAIDITSNSLYTFGLNSGHSSPIFNGSEFLEAGGGVTIGKVHDCKLKIRGSPHQSGYNQKYVIICRNQITKRRNGRISYIN